MIRRTFFSTVVLGAVFLLTTTAASALSIPARQSLQVAGDQGQASAPTLTNTSVSNPVPSVSVRPLSAPDDQIAAVSEQLKRLKAKTALFEKNAATQLNNLSQQSAVLTASVEELMKAHRSGPSASALSPSKDAVVTGALSSGSSTSAAHLAATPFSIRNESLSFYHWLSTPYGIGALGIFGFCLLLLTYFARRNRLPVPAQESVTTAGDAEDEFDFLNSEEGIAAKLDLARAYQAMQDYTRMRSVLEEVMLQGNANQIESARELMKGLDS